MLINAREIVGTGFPPDEGKKLADDLLARKDLDWELLAVDLTGCSPALLTSGFFSGFLQEVYDDTPELLADARKIVWRTIHTFQNAWIRAWMRSFSPQGRPVR